MIPDRLHIGPVPIHIFGLFLALGVLAAGWVVGKEFLRKGYDESLGSSVVTWAVVGGLLGARLWIIVDAWHEFLADPVKLLFSSGGFVWYGGLVGGALGASLVFRRNGVPWFRGADCIAPGLAVGQAIGRIGCQLAGDGDWGRPTTLPWGMAYPYAVVGWNEPPGVVVHPTPVYETIAYLLVFAFLWRRRHEPAPDGTQLAWYLVLACSARFVIEFVRVNPPVLFSLSQAQLMSLALVALGTARLVATKRQWRTAAA